MGVFIPKRMQRPAPLRPPQHRYCHWCASGPQHLSKFSVVMIGPMRWWFCSDDCCLLWHERRHERDIVEWLKEPAGTRAKVLAKAQDATGPDSADCRRKLTGLCSESRVVLSVPEGA